MTNTRLGDQRRRRGWDKKGVPAKGHLEPEERKEPLHTIPVFIVVQLGSSNLINTLSPSPTTQNTTSFFHCFSVFNRRIYFT
jgi:hypothetical protein